MTCGHVKSFSHGIGDGLKNSCTALGVVLTLMVVADKPWRNHGRYKSVNMCMPSINCTFGIARSWCNNGRGRCQRLMQKGQ